MPKGKTYATKKRRTRRATPMKGYMRKTGFYGFGKNPAEKLYYDIRSEGTPDATGSSSGHMITSLHPVPQGNGPNERKGRKITISKVSVRWRAKLNASSTGLACNLRLMLVLDKQCNGTSASPAVANNTGLLEAVPTNSDPVLAYYNLANAKRFTVLYDKRMALNALSNNGTLGNDTTKFGSVSKRLKLPIEFDASATDGSLATIRSNNLFWVAIANGNSCAVETQTRVRYSDA